MQLFIIFSIPFFLGHLIHQNREHIQELIPIRKRAVSGMLYAALALLILVIIGLFLEYRIIWYSVYLYSFPAFYLLPVFFVILMGKRSMEDYRREGDRGLLLFQGQLAGFFSLYNIGVYFTYVTELDQIILFFLPLFNLTLLIVMSRAMWRAQRFEIQWKFIMFSLLTLIFLAMPAVQMLYALELQFWSWITGLILLILSVLVDRFMSRLELDIQYRLSLEGKLKPVMRLFFRPGRRR